MSPSVACSSAARISSLVSTTASFMMLELVNRGRIAMKEEDDRAVGSEQLGELFGAHAVGMIVGMLQREQVDDVHDPGCQLREIVAQERDCGECLDGRDRAGGGEHDV